MLVFTKETGNQVLDVEYLKSHNTIIEQLIEVCEKLENELCSDYKVYYSNIIIKSENFDVIDPIIQDELKKIDDENEKR